MLEGGFNTPGNSYRLYSIRSEVVNDPVVRVYIADGGK